MIAIVEKSIPFEPASPDGPQEALSCDGNCMGCGRPVLLNAWVSKLKEGHESGYEHVIHLSAFQDEGEINLNRHIERCEYVKQSVPLFCRLLRHEALSIEMKEEISSMLTRYSVAYLAPKETQND